jgi:hypothetical protein
VIIFIVDVKTTGIDGISRELLRDATAVAKSALSKASTPLKRGMVRLLNVTGGPSSPGQPPAKLTGELRSTIGKGRPVVEDGDVVVHVGPGEGKAAAAKVAALRAEGTEIFAALVLHEFGGIGADGRRYPARSYARRAEREAEGEISAILERELG